MEIVPGIHRLVLPLQEAATVNIFLLKGRQGCLLIDGGWHAERCWDAVHGQLAEAGATMKDIVQVVYTHLHPDHVGLSGALEEHGVKLQAAHRLEIEHQIHLRSLDDEWCWDEEGKWLCRQGMPPQHLSEYHRITMDMHHQALLARPNQALEDGDVIDFPPFQLRVIWTPGHTPGHICLYEPRLKLLFAGDHICGRGLPYIGLFASYPQDEDLVGLFVKSTRSLKGVEVSQVLPAHGREFGGIVARLDEILADTEQVQQKVWALLDGGAVTSFEAAVRRNPNWEDMDPLLRRYSMREVAGRLRGLKFDGRAESVTNEGVISFKRNGPVS